MKILGKPIADEKLYCIKQNIIKEGLSPKLVIVRVGNDPASVKYTNNKLKAASRCNILCTIDVLDENISLSDFNTIIHNHLISDIDGLIVQLPIPKHLNLDYVNEWFKLCPIKDVDGLSTINIGKLHAGETDKPNEYIPIPCTAQGCMDLIHSTNIDINGKVAIVLGRSNIVGKSVARLLEQENATVIQCHSKTSKDKLEELGKQADIVIAAIGKPHIYETTMFPNASVFIDVGINVDENNKLCGDLLDTTGIADSTVRFISPVPGGVGPLTVANLMYNTYRSAKLRKETRDE